MTASRRSFLKATAAVPAAVAISALPATAAAVAVLPPLPPAPWQWWLSLDGGEVYTETFQTREAVIKAAIEYGGGIVAECQQGDYNMDVDGDAIIEVLYGQNEDRMGEDSEFIDITPEQERALGAMVSAAIDQWVRKHKIDTTCFIFDGVRNKAKVDEHGNPINELPLQEEKR